MTPQKFSIITVCYNASDTIGCTIESVKGQTYPGVEHILVDGQSADGTLDILAAYVDDNIQRGNPHSIVLHSDIDDGIYDAMNKGLSMATGDYVCFLNAGDCLPSADTLYNIAKKIWQVELHNPDPSKADCRPGVVYGDTLLTDNEGNIVGKRHLSAPEQLTYRSFRMGMLVCHQAFYARADIAKTIQYDLQYRFSADYDWCLRVLKQCEKQGLSCLNMHQVVAHYLQEGTTTRNHRASLRERFRIMRKHYGLIPTLFRHFLFIFRAHS